MKVTIPASFEDAWITLGGIDRLLTARQWERAAIVTAYVALGQQSQRGGRGGIAPESRGDCLACKEGRDHGTDEFARHGIVGLTNAETVAQYVKAWNVVGLPRPLPGQEVDLPTEPYPPTDLGGRNVADPDRREALKAQAVADGVGQSKVLDVASNKRAVAAAIKADPALAAHIAADPAAASAIARERERVEDGYGPRRTPEELKRERERKRLAENGPGLIELLDLSIVADKAAEVARKFVTPDDGPGAYSDNARIQIEAALAKGRAAFQHIEDVLNGRVDTRIPDDISGLVTE